MYDARLLREILDAQLEMLCRFRRDGTILFVNRAYAETLGRSPAELTGRSLWQFVSADDRAGVEAQVARLTPACPAITIENRFETPAGTRWVLWRNHGLEFDGDGAVLVAQSSGIDITERKQLEQQRQVLIDELNHRVRNTLTVVQGMARQTFRSGIDQAEALEVFTGRLHALAAAHTTLSDANWVGAELSGIVAKALAVAEEGASRITTDGQPVTLSPSVAVALALVLHELAANAVRHGAIADPAGTLSVVWRHVGNRLELDWRERGERPVGLPARVGFGSRLLDSTVRRQLGGELDLDFAPEGLHCRIAFALA